MRALCYKCNYGWAYGGKQRGKDKMSCPKCSYKLTAGKAIIGDLHSSQEELHTYIHNIPKKITYIHNNFVRISSSDGFDCLVNKSIAKQFKEAPEELEDLEEVQEEDIEEDCITIIKAPEIKIIPMKTPLEILEHHRSFR